MFFSCMQLDEAMLASAWRMATPGHSINMESYIGTHYLHRAYYGALGFESYLDGELNKMRKGSLY